MRSPRDRRCPDCGHPSPSLLCTVYCTPDPHAHLSRVFAGILLATTLIAPPFAFLTWPVLAFAYVQEGQAWVRTRFQDSFARLLAQFALCISCGAGAGVLSLGLYLLGDLLRGRNPFRP